MLDKLKFKLLGKHAIQTVEEGKPTLKTYQIGDVLELTEEESKASCFENKLEALTTVIKVTESKELLDKAQKEADKLLKEVKAKAQKEADKLLKEAQAEVEKAKAEAEKLLKEAQAEVEKAKAGVLSNVETPKV